MTSPKTESNTSLCNFVWNELDVVGFPMTSVALEFDVWPTTFPQCEAYLMGQSTKRSHCRLSVETWITYSSSLLGQSSQFRKVSNRQTAHLSSGQKSRLITKRCVALVKTKRDYEQASSHTFRRHVTFFVRGFACGAHLNECRCLGWGPDIALL